MGSVLEQFFGKETIRSVVANVASWTELGATAEQAELIEANGWQVVNAPRPLPCHIVPLVDPLRRQLNLEWTGSWHHGTFYAAGPANGRVNPYRANSPTFAERWRENDAWPVQRVTNADVEQAIRAYWAEHYIPDVDLPFEAMVTETGGMAELCRMNDLPWRTEES